MLRSLHLVNFAVAENISMDFGPGLTVITGETGAGKSIVVDALGLLGGGRAPIEVIRTGSNEAIVEAVIDRSEIIGTRLVELGLPDDGDELCLRRTISRTGRGRVHVNGAMTSAGVLQRLMAGLIDVGEQHEQLLLFDPAHQRLLIDRQHLLGGDDDKCLGDYQKAWKALSEAEHERSMLGGDERQIQARLEFLKFQLEEIDQIAPKPGEDVELEVQRRRFASIEKLRRSAEATEALIVSREGSASEAIGRAVNLVSEAERADPSLGAVRNSLCAAQAELDDAGRELSRYIDRLDADPLRLQEIEERLDALKRLCRKHVAPLEGVLLQRASISLELETLASRAVLRAQKSAEIDDLKSYVVVCAERLSVRRRQAAAQLEGAISERLAQLAMPNARFEVALSRVDAGPHGVDRIEFMFSANLGEALKPLGRAASGGEASRILLAIKAGTATGEDAICSVLDEADAGLGGKVADAVGRLTREISHHRQVLCITHLPQVAAHADAHLKIHKKEKLGRTQSQVSALESIDLRSEELARMLSGVDVSKEARGAAKALLRAAKRGLPRRSTRYSVGSICSTN